MPFLLRKIRKARWYPPAWVLPEDAPADALDDLKTKENALSVWVITDDLSGRERIIAALAARCDTLSNLDYCVFPSRVLSDVGINSRPTPGETPDAGLNAAAHLELIELSARTLALLAGKMRDATRERVSIKRVKALILASLTAGQIDETRLTAAMAAALDRSGPS